jgi:SAM-dependent methyltransferase
MCNPWCLQYWASHISKEEVAGKQILEVGAWDVNGSLRTVLEPLQPARYWGIDIQPGAGVDEVCRAEDLITHFGPERFDMIVCTELIEHVQDWKRVVSNLKQICKPQGLLIITTRSYGFPYHGYPADFWRYEIEDMRKIFADYMIETLEADQSEPGVFMKARKPRTFAEKDLSSYELYAVKMPQKGKGPEPELLLFTIEKDGQKITITEKTVIDMYHQIQRVRRMREQA